MNKRIIQLDSFRLIFAIIIVLSHIDYLGELDMTKFAYSYLVKPKYAINYFFVLSGFGIFRKISESNKILEESGGGIYLL